MFSHPDYDGHETLLFTKDAASGLRALIAIHDTTLGPAFGGCRMYPYASEQHAMTDVLRLSRGMTYKAAICELPYGGGKSVMIADPRRDKTPTLLHAMGRIIEGLGGRYITADDVGTTLADLIIMREVTCHTAGATAAAQQALPATAFGVFEALRAAAEVCLGRSDLEGLRVAVQGVGNVGMPLCCDRSPMPVLQNQRGCKQYLRCDRLTLECSGLRGSAGQYCRVAVSMQVRLQQCYRRELEIT